MTEFKPRWYQRQQLEAVTAFLEGSEAGNPLVCAPTGSGKAFMIAMLITHLMQNGKIKRCIMLTHQKELISQNFKSLRSLWPQAPCGIFSAGLKLKQRSAAIIYGGVKSVYNEIVRAENRQRTLPAEFKHFGRQDLLVIDEAHLVSPEQATTYRRLISRLSEINPKLRVVGYTATQFRRGQGYLTEGPNALFSEVVFDLCSTRNINRLVAEGYLAPLKSVPVEVKSKVDVSKLTVTGFDYSPDELSQQIQIVLRSAMTETAKAFLDTGRKKAMVFVSSVINCEAAVKILRSLNARAECVHSKKSDQENERIINEFKRGKIHFLVNMNKLTTGFDCPDVDLIAVVRATLSASLWVQMCGRGTRVAPGKTECLVLDFGQNIDRLGPFNAPIAPKPPKDIAREAPVKMCKNEECGQAQHASARTCSYCGYKFTFRVTFDPNYKSNAKIMVDTGYIFAKVLKLTYLFRQKPNGRRHLCITYKCQGIEVYEFLFPDIRGGNLLDEWRSFWYSNFEDEAPSSCAEAEQKMRNVTIRKPSMLEIDVNGKYPKVKSKIY